MSTGRKVTYTPEDLLAMANGDAYELVHGVLVERSAGLQSSRIGGRLFCLLDVYCGGHQLGWILPADAGYQCFPEDPNKVRKPDVSCVCTNRLSAANEPGG